MESDLCQQHAEQTNWIVADWQFSVFKDKGLVINHVTIRCRVLTAVEHFNIKVALKRGATMIWVDVCGSNTPPSWTYPQPVIQQAAPGGKDSLGRGKHTGRIPPTNNNQSNRSYHTSSTCVRYLTDLIHIFTAHFVFVVWKDCIFIYIYILGNGIKVKLIIHKLHLHQCF